MSCRGNIEYRYVIYDEGLYRQGGDIINDII